MLGSVSTFLIVGGIALSAIVTVFVALLLSGRRYGPIMDLEQVTSAMQSAGYRLVSAQGGPTDSGVAVYTNGALQIKVSRDKSQWMLVGEQSELEPADLWRAYDETEEFCQALTRYALAKNA